MAPSGLTFVTKRQVEVVGPDPARPRVVVRDVSGYDADVPTVESLARLQLVLQRCGCQLRLSGAGPELQDLLELMGLRDVVRCGEMVGQTEQREQGRAEEVGDADDPAL